MEEKVFIAALAGLLHDIGKFALRAGEKGTRTWDQEAQADYKYFHALLTSDYVQKYVPEAWRTKVKNLAANHHQPTSDEERLIRIADQLSAAERSKGDEAQEDDRTKHPRQLLRIFCSLKADGQTIPHDKYFPLLPLELDKHVLFEDRALEEEQTWKAYENLWNAFKQDSSHLAKAHSNAADLQTYIESMLLLLQRYTWCVPSAYFKSFPDVSLYDHGRMTAALAAILNQEPPSQEEIQQLSENPEVFSKPVASLVGGDISGVQHFIYTITARGATSALRGRSFYLQLLTEAIARYILRRLDLPITNLIYQGGGHFYLLAGPQAQAQLSDIQKDISLVLYQHHRGELYLALASIPLRGEDFYKGQLSRRWKELSSQLQLVKQRRFSELGDDLKPLFDPEGHGGNEDKQCQVCGMEHPDTKQDEEVRKCPPCKSYEELGDDLRKANYLILDYVDIPNRISLVGENQPGSWEEVLRAFGVKAQVSDNLPNSQGNPPAYERRLILALRDPALETLKPSTHIATGRRFLVNVTPTITAQEIRRFRERGEEGLPKEGSVKPFSAMAAQSKGIQRLGVLRMDIDNAGKLFAKGFGENASLSRVASLSFAISLFFEGWVEYLAEQRNQQGKGNPERGELLYSIYSGGDDLFFVGAWDEVVELARQIRADLKSYAADHPGIHASAGIVLITGKYPLAQAAQEAGHAEEQAKRLRWIKKDGTNREIWKEKDAITFLGQSLPWERFGLEDCTQDGMGNVHALMHRLEDMVENKGVNRAILRRLISLQEQYHEANEKRRREGRDQTQTHKPQLLWGPWNWLSFYTLSRMAKQTGDKSSKDIELLRNEIAKSFQSIEWIGLAARWAELITRK